MTDTLVTQCPACGTSFKLSWAQLNAANGAVRCGACLEVFSGEACLVLNSDENQLSDIPLDHGSSIFDTELPEADQQKQTQDPKTHWTDFLVPGSPTREFERDVDSDDESLVPAGSINNSDPHVQEPDTDDIEEDFATDWYHGTDIIYHVLDDGEFIEENSDEGVSADESLVQNQASQSFLEAPLDFVEPLDEAARQSLHETIDDNSVELVEIPAYRKSIRYYLTFGSLNLLFVLILALQFLWFNRNDFAEREDLRNYYLLGCDYLSPLIRCELPDYINLNQISTRKLIVRSHPRVQNALVIDAIILNSGGFAQPFPQLELKFTNLDFKTVASRRFDTSEYLGGELTGMKFIPAHTEVRLALEIVDPGEYAVSYELYAVHP